MRTYILATVVAFLAAQDIRAAEPAATHDRDRAPAGTIEFYDDEADFGDGLPQDGPKAEHLKMAMAMAPRIHNKILGQALSPNGRRVAYVVARDAGATTAESLHAFMGIPASSSEERNFTRKMLGDQIFLGAPATTRRWCRTRTRACGSPP